MIWVPLKFWSPISGPCGPRQTSDTGCIKVNKGWLCINKEVYMSIKFLNDCGSLTRIKNMGNTNKYALLTLFFLSRITIIRTGFQCSEKEKKTFIYFFETFFFHSFSFNNNACILNCIKFFSLVEWSCFIKHHEYPKKPCDRCCWHEIKYY